MDRHLAAILAADVVGYSRLIKQDEVGTIATVKANLDGLIKPKITQHNGRIVKLMGDGLLAEFPSVVDAVQCAVDIQQNITETSSNGASKELLVYRMGINIGDIVVDGDDIQGDGVNVAARLEALAKPGGICISRNVFNQVKDKLDLSFKHLGKKKIKNIAEPITTYSVELDAKAAAIATPIIQSPRKLSRPLRTNTMVALFVLFLIGGGIYWSQSWTPSGDPALSEKPSIAVLPFANIGNDPEQEFFSDGITNDLITDLSKFSSLFVIAANSTFTYKGKPVKVQKVAEDLGVRYVLEGSVQKTSDKIRINAQLIDATSGHHIWADRYDRESSDLFALQNEIIKKIVSNLSIKVDARERERALRKETADLGAYDLYLRAEGGFEAGTKESFEEARLQLEKAIELDPRYAKAFGLLASVHRGKAAWGWSEDRDTSMKLAYASAKKALELAPDDYDSHHTLGLVYLDRKEFDKANASFERVLKLNSQDPDVLAGMSTALIYLGRPEEAIEQLKAAMRYSPHFPQWYLGILGWASYDAGHFEEALAAMKKMNNPPVWVHRQLAVTYVRLERLEDAQKEIAKMLEREPGYRISNANKWPYKDQAMWKRYASDLRLAGTPE